MKEVWFSVYTIFIFGLAVILGYCIGRLQELNIEIKYLDDEQKHIDKIQKLMSEQDDLYDRQEKHIEELIQLLSKEDK